MVCSICNKDITDIDSYYYNANNKEYYCTECGECIEDNLELTLSEYENDSYLQNMGDEIIVDIENDEIKNSDDNEDYLFYDSTEEMI